MMRRRADRMTAKFLIPLRLGGFVVTVAIWLTVLNRQFSQTLAFILFVGGVLAVFPTAWLARRAVDDSPSIERTVFITSVVHILLMVFFGTSIIEAIVFFRNVPGWHVSIASWIGLVLLGLTGSLVILTVVNLALDGLGARWAILLSRRLAKGWMYSWTRNPMVLTLLAFLLVLGLYLGSLFFIVWVLVLFAPAILYFLKVYEERELEIRFGAPYQQYRVTTPFLWPRKPSKRV